MKTENKKKPVIDRKALEAKKAEKEKQKNTNQTILKNGKNNH